MDTLCIDSNTKISVVGLGLMGTAITERLLEAGYRPRVWNRTPEKAQPLIARGASWTDRPFVGSSLVILSLYCSDVVDQLLRKWQTDLHAHQIIIDTTTGDPAASVEFASRLAALDACYLEAPISGSSEQTRQGQATVIAAGDRSGFAACQAIWKILGRETFYVGPSGNAAKMKLVTNLVLGLNRAALAEGLAFAESIGMELPSALEVLRGSGAYSKQMDSKGPKMIQRNYEPQARLTQHLKDVRLILHDANETGLALPLTSAHEQLLEKAEALGWGDSDNSAVLEAIRAVEKG